MTPYSVLMSVYFREKPEFLDTALQSVFTQTVPPTQVILVKDGPLDTELDAVISSYQDRYPALNVVALPKNLGLGAALNIGIQHCEHELIARMDSDDISHPARFEKQLAAFEEQHQLSLVGSWVSEFENNATVTTTIRRVPETQDEVIRTFGDKCPVNHPSIMYRKSALIRAGGYRADYMQEDYDLWGRMLATGCIFRNIPECLVMMRTSDDQFLRRGGWRYAVSETRLQFLFLKLGLIPVHIFLRNVLVRFTARVMPNSARKRFYKTFLRGQFSSLSDSSDQHRR